MHLEGLKSTASLQLLLIREDVPFELQLIGTLPELLKVQICSVSIKEEKHFI